MEQTTILWRHLDSKQESRLSAVCNSWIGTPYMPGQRVKGMGVDCVQLVGGVLDELFKYDPPLYIPRSPQNAGPHFPRSGFRTASAIRKQVSSFVARDGWIEPGDIIVTRGIQESLAWRRLGHVLIAGAIKGTLIHAINGIGVCWTSVEAVPGILRVYRPRDKQLWV